MNEPSQREAPTIFELCEDVLGYTFHNPAFLRSALTHASGADHRLASNERLEFLGDAILGAIVCELLYLKFPEYLEGELTRIKSVVVSRRTCAKISEPARLRGISDPGQRDGFAGTDPFVRPRPTSSRVSSARSTSMAGWKRPRQFIVRHIEAEIDETVDGHMGIESQEQPPANRPAQVWRDADVPPARREGSRPFQVLQDRSAPLASNHYSARLGPEQERRRTASCAQCPEPTLTGDSIPFDSRIRGRSPAPPTRTSLPRPVHPPSPCERGSRRLSRMSGRWGPSSGPRHGSRAGPAGEPRTLSINEADRERFAGSRPGNRSGDLGLRDTPALRHPLLQVRPVLEHQEPRPPC